MGRPVSALSRGLLAHVVLALLGLALLASTLACGEPSPEDEAADRDEIQAFLGEYLPKMSEAYQSGDMEPLVPYTTLKERETIKRQVRERAEQGTILAPELVSLQVEDVVTWSAVNAFVTTVEVWNLRVKTVGSEALVREALDQSNRVKYQLKRENGRWRVFGRQLQETFE